MPKKKHAEHHENHERYLVTYSDLITLLLAFFIVLYAMSSPNFQKYDSLAMSFEVAFTKTSNQNLLDLNLNKPSYNRPITKQQLQTIKKAAETNQLLQVERNLNKNIKNIAALRGKVQANMDIGGLKITLPSDLLFKSGSATLSYSADQLLQALSPLLQHLPNPVVVSGYTDNVPISTPLYASNWELSSARADAVVRHLLDSNPNLNPIHYSAEGYGQYQPVASNATPQGRQKNRRVVIYIERANPVATASSAK